MAAVKDIVWPAWMGYPLVDGYGIEPQDRRLASEMDIGTIYRVEFDTDETIATCTLFLNALQAKWFESFERDFLRQGSRWFKLKLWLGGELLEHTVRFRERPKLTAKDWEYSTYSLTLDVAKREGLMETFWVDVLIDIPPFLLRELDEILQPVVNIDYPLALPFAE
jgi:hypothetical protein